MKVIIEVPAPLGEKVEAWLQGHGVNFEASGSKRTRFEMAFDDKVNAALVGLWDDWQSSNVGVLTIKAD